MMYKFAFSGTSGAVVGSNPITISDKALQHLVKLREEVGSGTLCLRMGVKSGGCSGMSYAMDFEKAGRRSVAAAYFGSPD